MSDKPGRCRTHHIEKSLERQPTPVATPAVFLSRYAIRKILCHDIRDTTGKKSEPAVRELSLCAPTGLFRSPVKCLSDGSRTIDRRASGHAERLS